MKKILLAGVACLAFGSSAFASSNAIGQKCRGKVLGLAQVAIDDIAKSERGLEKGTLWEGTLAHEGNLTENIGENQIKMEEQTMFSVLGEAQGAKYEIRVIMGMDKCALRQLLVQPQF